MVARIIISFLLCFLLYFKNTAQKVPVAQLINDARNRGAIGAYDKYIHDISQLDYHLPFIEEINFRTETDQFHLKRQEYALRTVFNSWNESSAYAKEKEHHLSLLLLNKEKKDAQILHQIFEDVQQWRCFVFTVPLVDSLIEIHKHQLESLVNKARLGVYISAKDILKEEEELFDYQEKKQTLHIKKQQVEAGLFSTNSGHIDWSGWISLSTMQKVIDSISFEGIDKNTSQHYSLLKSLNEWKYKAEKHNDQRILDFAQLRYSRRDNLLFQDEFSIGFGIRWPYKGSGIKEKNALLEKASYLDVEQAIQKNDGLVKYNELKQKFYALLRKHRYYSENSSKIFSVLNENHEENAVELLRVRNEHNLTSKIKQLELEEEITSVYLEMLHLNGSFNQTNKVNYLSQFLSPL